MHQDSGVLPLEYMLVLSTNRTISPNPSIVLTKNRIGPWTENWGTQWFTITGQKMALFTDTTLNPIDLKLF